MAPIGTYRKKVCTKCSKCLKVHLRCFKCNAAYHAKCLLKVPGFQADPNGHAFCCRNVTVEGAGENLALQEKLVAVKRIEEYRSDKDLESCSPDEKDSQRNKFKPGLVCSFRKEENFREESHEQHIEQCEEYRSRPTLSLEAHEYSTSIEGDLVKHSNERPFKCDTCDYAAKKRGELNSHILVKHSSTEKMHKCADCDYSAYKRQYLIKHRRVHANDRPFKCDSCDYTATRRADLNCHILVKHSNLEKKYKCSHCEYSTHRKMYLTTHERTHTNERPFKCDACNFTTTRQLVLNYHTLAKHSSAEKQYKCGECKYSAYRKDKLVNHMRTHAEGRIFKCDACDYAAVQRAALKYHVLTKHSDGEKKHKCNDCEYSTHRKGQLARHVLRAHADGGIFKCDSCDYAVAGKTDLESHVLTEHQEYKTI